MPGDALGPAHWRAVYDVANGWRKSRATGKMHNELRRQCRIAAGRQPEPTAAVIDSQSIKAAEEVSVPPGSHGALAGIATARPGTRHQRHAQASIHHGLRCDQLSVARTHDHAEAREPRRPAEGTTNAAIDPTASRAIGSISAGFRGSLRLEPMTWRIKTWTW